MDWTWDGEPKERALRKASWLDSESTGERGDKDTQPVAAGSYKSLCTGLHLRSLWRYYEDFSAYQLYKMGREPPCRECRFRISWQQSSEQFLGGLCAGILQCPVTDKGKISWRLHPGLRIRRRTRGIWSLEVFWWMLDVRQYGRVFPCQDTIRDKHDIPCLHNGVARICSPEPPDR